MWNHDFQSLMACIKLWHAMTNIGAINSRHTKTYNVIKIMDYREIFLHLVGKWHAMSSSHGKPSCY